MSNDDPGPPTVVSNRDVWLAIEQLRNENRRATDQLRVETSEARHSQTSLVTNAILELRRDVDVRLRSIERVMDTADPITLGPRLSSIEQWRAQLDLTSPGGAPARINSLEDAAERRRGAESVFRYVPLALSAIAAAAAIYANAKP